MRLSSDWAARQSCRWCDEPDPPGRDGAQVLEQVRDRGVQSHRLAGPQGEHLEAEGDLQLAFEQVAVLVAVVPQHPVVGRGAAARRVGDLHEVEVVAGVAGQLLPDDAGVHHQLASGGRGGQGQPGAILGLLSHALARRADSVRLTAATSSPAPAGPGPPASVAGDSRHRRRTWLRAPATTGPGPRRGGRWTRRAAAPASRASPPTAATCRSPAGTRRTRRRPS